MQLLAAASPGPAANGNVIRSHGQLQVCPQTHAESSLGTPTSPARAVRCRHVSDGVGRKTRDAPAHRAADSPSCRTSRAAPASQHNAGPFALCWISPRVRDGDGSLKHELICTYRKGTYGHILQEILLLACCRTPSCPPALHAASQLRCKQLIPVGSHQQPFLCADSEHPCLPSPVHGPGDFPQGPVLTKQLP